MTKRRDKGWHLPFEEQPAVETDAGLVAGGVVVMASLASTPLGKLPALTFRFEVPGLTVMPTVTLLLDAERLAELPGLVQQATVAAIRKAREGS